jgi:glycosyltransferase involved in cell wall biosynthesis
MARSVVFVSNIFPNHCEPVRGIYNLRQLLALRDRGWSISVVAPVFHIPFVRSRFGPFSARVAAHEDLEGLPVAHPRARYLPGAREGLHCLLYEWSIRAAVVKACRTRAPSFLWSAFAHPDAVAVGRIARSRGLPHVVSVLGSDINVGLQMRRRRRRVLTELGAARLVLARSRALRELLVGSGLAEARVAVAYNGVDRTLFRLRPPHEACRRLGVSEGKSRILYVGELAQAKGVGVLLQAFARLSAARTPGLELVIVGEGYLHDELAALASQLRINDRMVFVGQQSPERVALWMNASDLLCLSSLREGVPNVVLEALASGCPVVASRVGGVPEVHPGERAGLMVEPGNPSALSQALEEALHRAWDRPIIAACMQGWSWDANADQVEAAFRSAGLLK